MLQFAQSWLHNKFKRLFDISAVCSEILVSLAKTTIRLRLDKYFQYALYMIFLFYLLLQYYVPNKASNDEWFSITF